MMGGRKKRSFVFMDKQHVITDFIYFVFLFFYLEDYLFRIEAFPISIENGNTEVQVWQKQASETEYQGGEGKWGPRPYAWFRVKNLGKPRRADNKVRYMNMITKTDHRGSELKKFADNTCWLGWFSLPPPALPPQGQVAVLRMVWPSAGSPGCGMHLLAVSSLLPSLELEDSSCVNLSKNS